LTTEGSAINCTEPSIHELLASWELGLLPERDRLRVETHLLTCDACCAELYDSAPVAERLRGESGASSLPLSHARRASGRRRLVLAGSIAATVLIVAVTAVLLPRGTGEETAPHTRSGDGDVSVVVRAPVGEVSRPTVLDWEPLPEVPAYELRLSTSRGRLVWSAVVDAPPAELPEDVRETLADGAKYFWQVEALGDEGSRRKSELTEFVVTH